MRLHLHDVVAVVRDVPEAGLAAGEVGTIIAVFARPVEAFEVEFVDANGRTRATLTLRAEEIRGAGSE